MENLKQKNFDLFTAYLEKYKKQKDALGLLLHKSMDLFSHIPQEIQLIISKELDVSMAHISGVISFYSYFSFEKWGKNVIDLCTGTSCYVCDSKNVVKKVKEYLKIDFEETTKDDNFTLLSAKCLGNCVSGVSMRINDDLHENVTKDNVIEILRKYEVKPYDS